MRDFGRWLVDRWRGGDWRPRCPRALLDERPGRRWPPAGRPACRWCRPTTRWASVKRRHQGVQDTSPARPDRLRAGAGPRRSTGSSPSAATRSASCVRMGVPRSRMTVVPVRGRPRRASPRSGRPPTGGPDRPRILTVGRLVERKGFQTTWSGRWRACPTPSASSSAARRAGLLDDRPVRPPAAGPRRSAAGSPTGCAWSARCPARRWPAGTARPTCWSPRPGTSRSGSPRWRRWPAACRWSAPPSAGIRHRGRRASPATWCRPATRGRSAPRSPGCSPTAIAPRRLRRRRRASGPGARYSLGGRVADRLAEVYRRGGRRRGGRPGWWPDADGDAVAARTRHLTNLARRRWCRYRRHGGAAGPVGRGLARGRLADRRPAAGRRQRRQRRRRPSTSPRSSSAATATTARRSPRSPARRDLAR